MNFDPFEGFSMFNILSFIVPIFFIFIFGMIIFMVIRGIMQWNYNNHQPVLKVDAKVIAKRIHVSHHQQTNEAHSYSSTTYYVTFEVESGDRMEYTVPDREYGLMVEDDVGKLTFQGSRFLGFERTQNNKA